MPYGPFQHGWPYSNFHDLNLDWVISLVQQWAAEWKETQQEWADQQEAFNSLKSYVENYFENLDVQDEIDNKLDSMYESGIFEQMFANYFGKPVTPQMFGAKGDGVTDDSQAIADCLNSDNLWIEFPATTYRISNGVIVNRNNNLGPVFIDASKASIVYTGDNYAFTFQGVQNARISFGRVNANSGSCVRFLGTGTTGNEIYCQYINLDFSNMRALNDCILIQSEQNSWTNQININNGRFETGINSIRLLNNSDQPMDMITVSNVGFEVTSNGLYVDDGSGVVTRVTLNNPRYVEMASNIIKTVGAVDGLFMYGAETLRTSWFDFGTSAINVNLFAPNSGMITYNAGVRSSLNSVEGQTIIGNNADLNNFAQPGFYASTSATMTGTISNKPPITSAFTMSVISSNGAKYGDIVNTDTPYIYVIQTITSLAGSSVYYRYGSSNGSKTITWNEWIPSYISLNEIAVTAGSITSTSCQCYTKDGVVYLYINGDATSTNPSNCVSIPSQYAPDKQLSFIAASNDGALRAYVTTAGVIGFQQNLTTGTRYSAFVCWPYI